MGSSLMSLAGTLFGSVSFGVDFLIELIVLCVVLEFISVVFDWSKF